MTKEKEKKKGRGAALLPILFALGIGVPCGLFIARYIIDIGGSFFACFRLYLLCLLVLCGSYWLQIILHEGGHLLCGLLSGYRFLSFRVGSVMWVQTETGIRLRRFRLPGTGGQCLMVPPEPEGMPVLLYNLGGPLMNVLLALPAVFLAGRVTSPFLALQLRLFALLGLSLGAMNGIPLKLNGMGNDGYNALHLRDDPVAVECLWLQLKMNEQLALGLRHREMPEAWFSAVEMEKVENPLAATVVIAGCERLMDEGHFPEAAARIDELLEQAPGLEGISRQMLRCDRLFLDLLLGPAGEAAPPDEDLEAYMVQLKDYPPVLRTRYALALLVQGDEAQAEMLRERLEELAPRYPYPGELRSEVERMELLWAKAHPEGN